MKNFYFAYLLFITTSAFAQAGTVDNSFGQNGEVTTKIEVSSEAHAVAIQADGKIIAAGYCNYQKFALARYQIKGTLDSSFGLNGIVITDFGTFQDLGQAVAIDSSQKIIVVGYSSPWLAAVRYNQNGSLDSSFGTNGKIITTQYFPNAEAVVIQSDGKIIIAGFQGKFGNYKFC